MKELILFVVIVFLVGCTNNLVKLTQAPVIYYGTLPISIIFPTDITSTNLDVFNVSLINDKAGVITILYDINFGIDISSNETLTRPDKANIFSSKLPYLNCSVYGTDNLMKDSKILNPSVVDVDSISNSERIFKVFYNITSLSLYSSDNTIKNTTCLYTPKLAYTINFK